MRIAHVPFAVAVVYLLVGQAAIAQRGPMPDPLVRENATEKISSHVHVIPDNSVPLVPNVGIIVGTRATLVVDTGLGVRNAETIMREVAKVSSNQEMYLVTTHVHPEHDLGAMGFPPHTRMVRSKDQQQEIADTGLQMAEMFSKFSPLNAELLKGAQFRSADVSFDQEHAIDLGGARVRILAMGPNHTRGDTAVFVEPDGVLFSGDVVMVPQPAFASPQSSLGHWLTSLDRLQALQPVRIVPSHEALGDASIIGNYRAYLQAVQSRVAEQKRQGRSLDETVQAVADSLQGQYPDRGRLTGAIRSAYTEAP